MLQQTLEETNATCTPGELNRIPDFRSLVDPDAVLVEALKARTPAAFDDLVKQWRTNGGDTIRAEYEQAFQAK